MVGVPGKSRGCRTCKRRKVRCDETKPSCARCGKAFLICEGYDKGTIFVDQGGRREYLALPARKQLSSASSEDVALSVESKSSCLAQSPSWLGPPGDKMDIYLVIVTHNLFSGGGLRKGGQVTRPWVLDAIDADKTSVIYNATCGLAAALYNRIHPGALCSKTSALYYGQALRLLNKNLQDPELCWSATNVAASFLLSIYEMAVYNNSYGWMQHAGGLEQIIQLRGPKAHRKGVAQKYFFMCRLPILGRAIAHRKRTFLEEDSWKLSCLIDGDVPQEPVHQLLDIWTAIPGLLEDSDALLADRSKREHRVEEAEEDFLRRLRLTMTRMFSWRWQFERRFPGAAYEKQVVRGRSITVDDAGAPLFDTVLFYEHLHQGARPITMYNLALLQLMHIASSWKILDLPAQALASMDIRTTSAHAGPLLLPHEHLSLKDVSQEVCRSIEYHLLDDHDSNGAINLLMPIRGLITSGQEPRITRWLVRILRRISQQCGLGISERLSNLKLIDGELQDGTKLERNWYRGSVPVR